MAGEHAPQYWERYARTVLCSEEEVVNWIEYFDISTSQYRAARFTGERLDSCIFIPPNKQHTHDWLLPLFSQATLSKAERASLLSGQALQAKTDIGRIVCACFSVGEKTIRKAITAQQLDSVGAIGKCLQAGTNGGSCLPELEHLLSS